MSRWTPTTTSSIRKSTTSVRQIPATPLGREATRGFTLLEVMAVVLILGTVLLVVPLNMEGWGARSRLEMGGNSVVSALRATKEQAITDGYDTYLQLSIIKINDEERSVYRFKYTNVPTEKSLGQNEDESDLARTRSVEREWQHSEWLTLPEGVEWNGVSVQKGAWRKVSMGGKIREVHFDAGGNIDIATAIRVRSADLEVSEENKIITVTVNGLTSEPSLDKGRHELRESLDASVFQY